MASRLDLSHLEVFRKKSMWSGGTPFWDFFCPKCRIERRVPLRSRPGGVHVFQVLLTSLFLTLILWPVLDWKGILSFVPLWTVFEVVYRLRIRMAMPCSNCGFDPYLYLTDVKRARKEIEAFWRAKFAEKGIPFPEKPSEDLMEEPNDEQEESNSPADDAEPSFGKFTDSSTNAPSRRIAQA